jgi:hypothetical protein
MSFNPKPDYNRASITLYYVVALNTKHKLKNTINRKAAAQVLADLLQVDNRAPASWLRGDFKKHPMSRENFLRFVRVYRTKPGLETSTEIRALAVDLYGSEYKRVLELLDPVDREVDQVQKAPVTRPGEANLMATIFNLLETSPPEEVRSVFVSMIAYHWSVRNLRLGKYWM